MSELCNASVEHEQDCCAKLARENQVTATPAALSPEEDWFEQIRPDFTQGNVSIIAGAAKLIEAKKALKKNKGSFVRLVERLDLDLDKAERLMKIARHPVLRDSAHARNLPLSWMTLYTLAALPPKALEDFIADGTVHPRLERKQAERLVQKVRGSNSNGARDQGRDGDRGTDHGGDHVHDHVHGGDRDGDPGGDHDTDSDRQGCAEQNVDRTRATQTVAQNSAIGPDSRSELDRKWARLEELERETRRQEIQRAGYESEIEELKAKLGPEIPIRPQQRLFQQAMRALEKSDAPGMLEKESRFLKQSAVTDLIELVRSAVRDGLKPDRFDLFYRPEPH
jgi:hypothetical protein